MTRPSDSSPRSAKQLMETMTGSDALPVFVQRIDPHTLKNLVDDVGIEDAGPLIAHVSENQLVHLLDETIWTGARPGDPDKLSVAELLRWLDLWNGLGARFAADKLYELGADFCALAFSRLLVVSDNDLMPRIIDEHIQAVGTFLIRVRVDDEWDTVQSAINGLWEEYPDFTESVLGRLAFRHSALNMTGEDDTARVLDADAGAAHEQGREQAGYVTSIMAGSFLRTLAGADVDQLAAETTYDLQTAEYFRRRHALRARAEAEGEAAELVEPDPLGDASDSSEQSSSRSSTPDESDTADPGELETLTAELEAYERAQHRPVALLEGPQSGSAGVRESEWVRLALGRLQEEPGCFDARMDELTYLANLLMVGAEADGERLESGVAAQLVVATCNLGASHTLWLTGEDDPVAALADTLSAAPGLVRLFRIGWHLLSNLPREAAVRVTEVFEDTGVRQRLQAKPWVLSEVDALLASPDFTDTVVERNYADARETLKILGIALEPAAVVVLCLLTDGVPRFARVLEAQPSEAAVMTFSGRWFATMDDLIAVHRFLDRLTAEIRL